MLRFFQGENWGNDGEGQEEDGAGPSTNPMATANGATEENLKLLRVKIYDMEIARTKTIVRV